MMNKTKLIEILETALAELRKPTMVIGEIYGRNQYEQK